MSNCKLPSTSAQQKSLSYVSPACAPPAAQTSQEPRGHQRKRRSSGLCSTKNKQNSAQQRDTTDVKKVHFDTINLCLIQALQSQVSLISILSESTRQALASSNTLPFCFFILVLRKSND